MLYCRAHPEKAIIQITTKLPKYLTEYETPFAS